MAQLRVVVPLLVSVCLASPPENILRGKKLVLVPMELPAYMKTIRNSTGHVTGMEGISFHILEWLAKYYGFQYSIRDVQKTFLSSGNNSGAKYYIDRREADMILSAIVLTPERARDVDFPFPFYIGGYTLIIPFPEKSTDLLAPWKAFELKVWVLIFISAIAVTVALVLVSRGSSRSDHADGFFLRFYSSSNYVLKTFFAQGGVCYPKRTSIRLIAATWCLAAFVVANIYNKVLVSFVSSPNLRLMIDSVYDIPKNPDLRVVVDEGLSADVILSSAQSGILKYMGTMLNKDPSLRCNAPEKCLEKVKLGSYAYVEPIPIAWLYINDDFKKNFKCSLTQAKNEFLFSYASFSLPKGSPYTSSMSHGMITLWETGLLSHWHSWYVPVPYQCLQVHRQKVNKPRLSMKHLSSAFVILGGGCCASLILFVGELLSMKMRHSSVKINISP